MQAMAAMRTNMEACVNAYAGSSGTSSARRRLLQATTAGSEETSELEESDIVTSCTDPETVNTCDKCMLKARQACMGDPNPNCLRDEVCTNTDVCKTGVCEGYDEETRLTESTKPDDLLRLIEQEIQGSARSKVSAGWSCG